MKTSIVEGEKLRWYSIEEMGNFLRKPDEKIPEKKVKEFEDSCWAIAQNPNASAPNMDSDALVCFGEDESLELLAENFRLYIRDGETVDSFVESLVE